MYSTPDIASPEMANAQWQQRFAESGKLVTDLKGLPYSKRPKVDSGKGVICLSFHLKGQCFVNCKSRESHRALSGKEKTAVQAFLDSEL